MSKKNFFNLKKKSQPSTEAELRLSENDEIEVLPVLVDTQEPSESKIDDSEVELREVSESQPVKLFESSVSLDHPEEGTKEETGKSFRSKELSEEDLSERASMPSIEEQWVTGEKSKRSTSWLKQSIVVGALFVGGAVIWAFANIDKESISKEDREKEIIRLELLSQEEDAARAQDELNILNCIKGYMESTTIEERAKWCRKPKITLAKMVHHYNDKLTFDTYHFDEIITKQIVNLFGDEMTVIIAGVSNYGGEFNTDENKKNLLLQKQADGTYLVDWDTATVYQPSNWQSFVENMITEPNVFRLEVMNRNDYGPYLYTFSNDNKYQAYRVNIRANEGEFLVAYAPKDSAVDKKLKSLFTNKKPIQLTLKLAFPENSETNQCVEIIEIVSESWFLK